MENKSVRKDYNKIKNKLHENFEDVKYLIALHNQILQEIESLNNRIDRLWSAVDSIYTSKINENKIQ